MAKWNNKPNLQYKNRNNFVPKISANTICSEKPFISSNFPSVSIRLSL